MSFFQIISGKKTDISERQFQLLPYEGAFALAVTGSEVDTDYEIYGLAKNVDADSVSLIVNFSQDEDYHESYIEYELDYVNQRVALFLIVDAVKAEALSREYPILRGVDYTTGLRAYIDDEGDLVVLCYIGTTEVLRFYYPAEILTVGMWGFKTDGADGKTGTFTDYFRVDTSGLVFLNEILDRTRLLTSQVPYWKGWNMVKDAMTIVAAITKQTITFKTMAGDIKIAVKSLAGMMFLGNLSGGGSSSGMSFTLGPLSVSRNQAESSTVNASTVLGQLTTEYNDAIARLTGVTPQNQQTMPVAYGCGVAK